MSTALVLLRRDLRLTDYPALTAACTTHDTVLPVYVHALHEEAPWQPSATSRWMAHSRIRVGACIWQPAIP